MSRKERALEIRANLIELSKVRVGMSNGAEVIHRAEAVVLGLNDLIIELIDSVDALSSKEPQFMKREQS